MSQYRFHITPDTTTFPTYDLEVYDDHDDGALVLSESGCSYETAQTAAYVALTMARRHGSGGTIIDNSDYRTTYDTGSPQ